jgi:quinol-cytochrome oxidoreductase complex cytochrome b subunit
MSLGWLGRFGVLFAIVAPIAVVVLCGLIFVWPEGRPCVCTINDVLDPPAADPMEMRILPPWYLAPAVAVLRAITFDVAPFGTKLLGLLTLVAMLIAPLALSFFNWSKATAPARFSLLALWPILIGLGWIGWQRPTDALAAISLALIGAYFALFLIVFPLLARSRA